jgi:peroxiredoxin
MPSSFVIDGKGEIRHRHVGFKKVSIDAYEDSILSLLNELKQG